MIDANFDKDMERFSVEVDKLTNSYAGVSVSYLEDSDAKKNFSREEITSLLVAAAINFSMKTMVVAGFSKEEAHLAVETLFDHIKKNDIHAQLADAMREARQETKQ